MHPLSDNTPKVYLSKRNLLALLSKLERDTAGEDTACTILKHQQPSPAYRQTMKEIAVIAVHDEDYYGAQARPPGIMHHADESKLTPPSTGVDSASSLSL